MTSLRPQLRRVRRRLLSIGAASGTAWGLLAATALLLLGAWLDLLWELSPQWRVAAIWTAGAGGAMLLLALVAATVRAAREAAVARRIDEVGGAGGRVVTGWEIEQGRYGVRGEEPSPLSVGLAALAVEDGAAAARPALLSKTAPVRPLGRSLAALALLWAAIGMVVVCAPGFAHTQWNRFLKPFDDVPPFSFTEFDVTPGDVSVVYGGELEIRVAARGAPVDHLELVLEAANGREPPLPMFPEPDGVWRAVLAKVVEPADYFVRAYRARSPKYHINVITVPLIEQARVRVVQPDYAHRAPYEGPLPKDGVSGLRGTKIDVVLRSNRPLRGGTVSLTREKAPSVEPIPMETTESGSRDVIGRFVIEGNGKFECRVIDEAGQASQQSFSGNFVMLADERPFVRLLEPPKTSLATAEATLPVVVSAEDDCGISRLQLFRSLNDSRSLPLEIALAPQPPRRFEESAYLPLGKYGLAPGDVIKVFGRVEDNDPDGVKGAESPIATVRIVTQGEFEQMFFARQGMDAVLSKYYAARRRMESLTTQMDELQKKLESLPPDQAANDEIRREMEKLQEAMENEAAEIRKSAQHPLPLDLDKNLTPRLKQLAAMTEEMAKQLSGLQRAKDLLNKDLADKLAEMGKQLASEREQYNEQVAQPLEYFEVVFPLVADRERFVALALWQKDFAHRLALLKDREGDDSPSRKVRMRDLEQEQRQISEELAKLLDDIQQHSEKLPDISDLAELRDTAQKFVRDVRASGATEAMSAAEDALDEFAATRAHEKAQEAADILDSFLKKCHGMGDCACNRLKFQPSLSDYMGKTVDQLLAGMGLGSGGVGYGASGYGLGGFGGSVGLYGGLPAILGREGERGDARDVSGGKGSGIGGGKGHGENPDDATSKEAVAPGTAGGAAEGIVPLRYRRQVGQYFQRVAEETGEIEDANSTQQHKEKGKK